MITSCCPGWIKYAEHFYPDMLDNISTCKSPHQMEGAIVKSFIAANEGVKKENIVMVSVMPCTAKKFEILRRMNAAQACRMWTFPLPPMNFPLLKDAEIQLEAMDPQTKYDGRWDSVPVRA